MIILQISHKQLAFITFFSLRKDHKYVSSFQQVGRFCLQQVALYFKGIPNSVDFPYMLFLFVLQFHDIIINYNKNKDKYCVKCSRKRIFYLQVYSGLQISNRNILVLVSTLSAHNMKFFIKDFFSKCEQCFRKLQICSHFQKKSIDGKLLFLWNDYSFQYAIGYIVTG